jgi:hypothetical protein
VLLDEKPGGKFGIEMIILYLILADTLATYISPYQKEKKNIGLSPLDLKIFHQAWMILICGFHVVATSKKRPWSTSVKILQ